MSKLTDWIDREGARRVAELLGVTPHAVWHWKAGRRVPERETARRIVEKTNGAISFDDIYGGDNNA